MKEQTRNTDVPINEEEIGKIPEKEFNFPSNLGKGDLKHNN